MPEPTNSGGSLNGHTPPPPTSIPVNEFLESFRAKKSGDGPKPPPDEPDAEPSPVDPTPPRDPIPPGRASAKPEPPPPEPEEGPAATPPPPPIEPIEPAATPRYLGPDSAKLFPPLVIEPVELNEALIKAAIFVDGGEDQIVRYHMGRFEEVNNAKAIELRVLFLQDRYKQLKRELSDTIKLRRRVTYWNERVTANTKKPGQPWFSKAIGWGQFGVAVVALVCSNAVGGQYVYRSGDDQFASSPMMACLFYSTAVLAAALIEGIHLHIKTEHGRGWFRLPFMVVGVAAAASWGIAMSTKYSSETAHSSYLHRPELNFLQAHAGAIVLTSNFLVDVCAGFIALSAFVKQMSEGYVIETTESPIHRDLRVRGAAIDAEIKGVEAAISLGSKFFSELKAARRALEAKVRISFRLACAQRLGDHAKADGQFLAKPKGPIA